MLKKLDYPVCSVPGGEEAVEDLKENAVDLVVSDMTHRPRHGWSRHLPKDT